MNEFELLFTAEKAATEIRKLLEMDEEKSLNPEKLEEIIDRIQKHNNRYKISEDLTNVFTFLNDGKIEIKYKKEAEEFEKFIYVIKSFCYGLIHYKEHEGKDTTIDEQEILYDQKTTFLARAFILPEKMFRREVCENSDVKGKVYIHEMSRKLKLPFRYLEKRGNSLRVWTPYN
ncbi:MAG: hypothetical protein Q4E75_00985 [bacterium]|nr:hypothetical protein [bacterium]